MAEVIPKFDFKRLHAGGSTYDEFLDGQIWKLSSADSPSGVADIRSMQSSLANLCKRRGLKFRSNVISEPVRDKNGKIKRDADNQPLRQQFLVIQATTTKTK